MSQPSSTSSAFITPILPLHKSSLSSRPLRTSSPCLPTTSISRRSHVVRASATKETGKKKAPVVFAKDIKGNFVWTLRSAKEEDVDDLARIFQQGGFTPDLIEDFITTSGCSMVCEASIKGTKEGEGYLSKIMGGVLVDVQLMVKDPSVGFESGFIKKAELLCTAVDSVLPDPHDVRKKMILGALKKMKENGIIEVRVSVSNENDKGKEIFGECLFKQKGKEEDKIWMVCDLQVENPDPLKKVV